MEKGIAVTDAQGFVTTPDGMFCYTQITPETSACSSKDNPDKEELPSFVPSAQYGKPVSSFQKKMVEAALPTPLQAPPYSISKPSKKDDDGSEMADEF